MIRQVHILLDPEYMPSPPTSSKAQRRERESGEGEENGQSFPCVQGCHVAPLPSAGLLGGV